ncbi:MAG: NmrA/HSCARG family protein [Gemmatimonadaceae bacterium]
MAEKKTAKKTGKQTDKQTDKQTEKRTDKKIIAVIGATGAQGGGLVRAILEDKSGQFAARAITRTPNSDKAKALADAGAEVVAADTDDVKSLKKAFTDAYGAFCMTNFWEHMKPEKELSQARNMAQAAKDAGVKHVIWSTLEDTRQSVPISDDRMPTLMGKYKVPHFDAKGEANAFFAELGVPTTYLVTSFYWDNFIHFGMGPKKGPDGKLAITLPMGSKKLPSIAAEDIGKTAYAIFEKGEELIGKTVGIAGGHLSGAQMAKSLTKALGQPIAYNAVTPAAFRSFGFPGADDLANMFQFNSEFEQDCCDARNISETKSLNPELQTFDRWLSQNKSRIPLG